MMIFLILVPLERTDAEGLFASIERQYLSYDESIWGRCEMNVYQIRDVKVNTKVSGMGNPSLALGGLGEVPVHRGLSKMIHSPAPCLKYHWNSNSPRRSKPSRSARPGVVFPPIPLFPPKTFGQTRRNTPQHGFDNPSRKM